MINQPLCFVLMPFGIKPDSTGTAVDFDAVYRDLIAPAITDAEMQPLRADEEITGGIIHKPMFERLLLCDFAIADLTTANPNVFYELGIRHAVRPCSTVLIYNGGRLPFDVAPLRAFPYSLSGNGAPDNVQHDRKQLTALLVAARDVKDDSPLFELIDDLVPPDLAHLKTDVFRDRMEYSAELKEKLAVARTQGVAALQALEKSMGDLANLEAAVVIDLFLSYRSVEAWAEMVRVAQSMPKPLSATVMVQEQLALAKNRIGQSEAAEQGLLDLIAKRGPSSETYGILGRVYKDRWSAALKNGQTLLARGVLDKAISAYLTGFETDWRDAYPGVNAVTLMELRNPPDPRLTELLPVVRYAVSRKIARGNPDYWDYATVLELSVLANDQDAATTALGNALAAIRESWEPKTTVNNLRLIREARAKRGQAEAWIQEIENSLQQQAVAVSTNSSSQ